MDFNPKDKSLWTNDNQVDGMGDEQPPGELIRIAAYGSGLSAFPGMVGGRTRTTEYKSAPRPPTWFSPKWSRPRTPRTLD